MLTSTKQSSPPPNTRRDAPSPDAWSKKSVGMSHRRAKPKEPDTAPPLHDLNGPNQRRNLLQCGFNQPLFSPNDNHCCLVGSVKCVIPCVQVSELSGGTQLPNRFCFLDGGPPFCWWLKTIRWETTHFGSGLNPFPACAGTGAGACQVNRFRAFEAPSTSACRFLDTMEDLPRRPP